MSFELSKKIDKNKIFLVSHSELEGRLDPFFYRTDLRTIDRIVHTKTNKNLGDFALSINGGATPLKEKGGEYYSDESSGIPFLRVKNITEEGINSDDLIFINRNTHENYLYRSRVFGGDLLVTITGRIASSTVIPDGFEGNINQHSVVIRTENKDISEYLATFLNSSVGQKLAIKRTTGGTRPALDYKALSSIPIIEKLPIVKIMQKAYTSKKKKEVQAQKLLDSINNYLLDELGIEFSIPLENIIRNRIFYCNLNEISEKRFDPSFYLLNKKPSIGKYEFKELNDLAIIKKGDSITSNEITAGPFPVVAGGKTSPYFHNVFNYPGDVITVSASGAYSGYVRYHDGAIFASDCSVIRSKNDNLLNNIFLFEFLKLKQKTIYSLQQGSGQPHVYPNDLSKILIPLPPLKKQTEIAAHITSIRDHAKNLKGEAKTDLERIKKKVESIILRDDQ